MAFLSMPSKACLLVFKWGVEGWGSDNQVKQVGVGRSKVGVGRVLQTDREVGTKAQSQGVPSCKVRTKFTCPGQTVEG